MADFLDVKMADQQSLFNFAINKNLGSSVQQAGISILSSSSHNFWAV